MIGRLRAWWSEYWFAPVPPHTLARVRMLLGIFLFGAFARLLPDVDLLFARGGVRYSLLLGDVAPSISAARVLYGAMLGTAALFALGVKSRWMARATLGLFLYHYLLALAVCSMVVDRLIIIFLVIASCAEMDRAWALWPERSGDMVSVWPQRAFTLQLAFLYAGAGAWKLTFPAWRAGEALRENLHGSWGTELGYAIARLPIGMAAWQLLTWSIIGLELLAGAMLLSRRTAPLAALLATGFHLAVLACFGIWEFLICVAVLPAALAPEHVARACDVLSRRFRTANGRSA